MNRKHHLFVVVLVTGFLVGGLSAQVEIHTPSRPGGFHNGRYIGFVPKHEKFACQPACAACADTPIPPLWTRRQTDTLVTQVAHEEELPLATEVDGDGDVAYEDGDLADGDLIYEDGDVVYGDGRFIPGADCKPPMAMSSTPLIWGRIDYLQWWTRGMQVPPLATTSPDGTDQDAAGVLGQPETSILFGNERLNKDGRSGGRLTLGRMINPECGQSLEVTYLQLAEESDEYLASGADFSILARPFFNTIDQLQDSRLIVFPDLVEGTVMVISSTEFQTLEAVFRQVYAEMPGLRADYFVGYRYADLKDFVRINEATVSLSGPPIGSTFSLFDQFDSQNEFHGGEFGIRLIRQKNACWSLECTAQIALGNTQSLVRIDGETVATSRDGNATVSDTGLLTQGTNIGDYKLNKFSGIAELGITARHHFACGLTARLGYTAFFWSDVIRAGDQIDLNVNTSQIPPGQLEGPPAPIFLGETSGFWAQGLNVGLEYSY